MPKLDITQLPSYPQYLIQKAQQDKILGERGALAEAFSTKVHHQPSRYEDNEAEHAKQAQSQSDNDPLQFNDMFAAMAYASYAIKAKAQSKVEAEVRQAAIEAGDVIELRAA